MKYYLSVDIGGTKTSVALFAEDAVIVGDIVHVVESRTHQGTERVYRNTVQAILDALQKTGVRREDILGMGVGAPGPLDTRRGVIIHAPLMHWRNFPLTDRLSAEFSMPVRLDNDGNLGALAESRCGKAVGADPVIYITVSTGIGGGLVSDGRIYHGFHDGALEVGHMSVEPHGPDCPCGRRGCLELYASGTAIMRRIREDMAQNRRQSMAFSLAGYAQQKLTAKLLAQAAWMGDPYALSVFADVGRWLGIGVSNLFTLFDPAMVVIGGGVSKANAFFRAELIEAVRARSIHHFQPEQIQFSELCDRVVLYGAYWLIREALVQ